jgi:surface antigen
MKRAAIAIASLFVLSAPTAFADPDHDRGHERSDRDRDRDGPPGHEKHHWGRGERMPAEFFAPRYFIDEPRMYHLEPPPRGHRWVFIDGDGYLVEMRSGLVVDFVADLRRDDDRFAPPPPPDYDREARWRSYTADDDSFYRDCHQTVNPAGVLAGAVLGGLLGNAAGHGRADSTVAGVVLGGAAGAALTSNLDCQDRGYVYKTYANGFNAGRPNAIYQWRNPGNGHYGEFRVVDYYRDPDGFRCANYTQRVFIEGRPREAHGRACQQRNGAWAIVS